MEEEKRSGTDRREENNNWHLDKRVPIALILALFIQTSTAIWWAASISSQQETNTHAISSLHEDVAKQREVTERVVRIEVLLQGVLDTLNEIKTDIRDSRQ